MPLFPYCVLSSQIKVQARYYSSLPSLPLISLQPQMITFLLFLVMFKGSFTLCFKLLSLYFVLNSFLLRQNNIFKLHAFHALSPDLIAILTQLFVLLHSKKQSQIISRVYFCCLCQSVFSQNDTFAKSYMKDGHLSPLTGKAVADTESIFFKINLN